MFADIPGLLVTGSFVYDTDWNQLAGGIDSALYEVLIATEFDHDSVVATIASAGLPAQLLDLKNTLPQ